MRRIVLTAGIAVAVGATWIGHDTPSDTPYRIVAEPGHGRGMSQVGAFDSAREGWTADRILAQYYPGAALATAPRTTVGVRLVAQDDSTLDAYAPAGLHVAGRAIGPGQAAHLTATPDGGATVVVTTGCDGEVLWQGSTHDPWIHPIDPRPDRPAAEHLTLCGGSAYRGALGVATEGAAARTVNRVDIEDYLRGLVPAEVQANWADQGAREALRAQAIAARSYVLAEHRYPYAQTCDTTDCQVYPGTAAEDPRATAAVTSTAGAVLLRDGRILRAEYSAAPDGGEPGDVQAMEVGPAPVELSVGKPPADPRGHATAPETAIDAEYHRIGGATSDIGPPLGPEMGLPENAGTYRLFTNGVIIATPTLGAQVVDFTTLMQLVPDSSLPQPHSPKPVPQGVATAGPAPETSGAPAVAEPDAAEPGSDMPDTEALEISAPEADDAPSEPPDAPEVETPDSEVPGGDE